MLNAFCYNQATYATIATYTRQVFLSEKKKKSSQLWWTSWEVWKTFEKGGFWSIRNMVALCLTQTEGVIHGGTHIIVFSHQTHNLLSGKSHTAIQYNSNIIISSSRSLVQEIVKSYNISVQLGITPWWHFCLYIHTISIGNKVNLQIEHL